MDPERITTAVVVEPNGRIRHVPTEVITADGKYYAKVNSLTDSTYTVIWNPISFADVEHHWAMQTVNNMGSRLVVYGTGDENYSPDRNITRAEFTAILVRGLGLRPETGESVFSDIKVTDWYNGVVNAAYEYQLVKGFDDGTFRPNEEITREQAMMMIANAMKITGLDKRSQSSASNTILSAFHDLDDVSHWARDAVRDTVQAGIIIGRSQTELAPKQYILRSEVATMIERLLKKSGLI